MKIFRVVNPPSRKIVKEFDDFYEARDFASRFSPIARVEEWEVEPKPIEYKKAHRHVHQAINGLLDAHDLLRNCPVIVIDGITYLKMDSAKSCDHAYRNLEQAIEEMHKVLGSDGDV